jgi:predicted RNase H-like nuclease (RuvC/YqgF family)
MEVGAAASPAVEAIQNNQHDPLIVGLLFVLAAVIVLAAIAKPMMGLYREYKRTGTEGAKAEAESVLFTQLNQQLTLHGQAIERLENERNSLMNKTVQLEKEVDRLKTFEQMVDSMKTRLNEKDAIIEQRNGEVRNLMRTILDMKDRLHALEMRLIQDEQQFCRDCAHKGREIGITPST